MAPLAKPHFPLLFFSFYGHFLFPPRPSAVSASNKLKPQQGEPKTAARGVFFLFLSCLLFLQRSKRSDHNQFPRSRHSAPYLTAYLSPRLFSSPYPNYVGVQRCSRDKGTFSSDAQLFCIRCLSLTCHPDNLSSFASPAFLNRYGLLHGANT